MKHAVPAILAVLLASGCAPLAVGTVATPVAYSVAQERSTTDAIEDAEIKVRLKSKLFERSAALFADVGVDVQEGRVVLTGSVPEREDKVAATEAAWAVPGVAAVDDQLTVGEEGWNVKGYTTDVMISNQVRYDLLTDAQVRSLNYNVETVDGVVHLTGLARSPEELRRVINHARTTRGVTKVVSHVLTIDDPRRFARQG